MGRRTKSRFHVSRDIKENGLCWQDPNSVALIVLNSLFNKIDVLQQEFFNE
jgi:hypothetical protein